jgi:hypothetical protein
MASDVKITPAGRVQPEFRPFLATTCSVSSHDDDLDDGVEARMDERSRSDGPILTWHEYYWNRKSGSSDDPVCLSDTSDFSDLSDGILSDGEYDDDWDKPVTTVAPHARAPTDAPVPPVPAPSPVPAEYGVSVAPASPLHTAASAATPPIDVQADLVRLTAVVLAQQQVQLQLTHNQDRLADAAVQQLAQQRESQSEARLRESQLISAVGVMAEHVSGPVTERIGEQVTVQGQHALQLEVLQKSDIQLRAQVHSMQQQLIYHEYILLQQKKKKKKKKKGRQTQSKSVPAACSVAAAATASASVTTVATSASAINMFTTDTASVTPAAEVGTTATAIPATCAAVLSAPTPACPSRFVATSLLCFLLALLFVSASASAVSQDSTVPLPSFQHWWVSCNRLTGMATLQAADSWPRTLPCKTDGDGSRVFDDGG